MSRERTFRNKLLEIYKQLNIRRGLSEEKINRLMSECGYIESNLSDIQIDNIAARVLVYLKEEEPDNHWGSEK